MPKKKDNSPVIVTVNGVEYVRREMVDEALIVVSGLSELYDNLAAHPSEPTAKERKQERSLSKRWFALSDRLDKACQAKDA